jgi:hypothetical protein
MKKGESKSAEKKFVSWKAPEFRFREKGINWHLWAIFIGLALIGVSVWQKNFLFAAFVVIAWFVVVYWANKKPVVWEFKLNENGISIKLSGDDFEKFRSYSEISGFDIHEGGKDFKELVFKLDAKLSPYLKAVFPSAKEKEIEEFLLKFLPKEEYERSASDSFSELIGF